MYSANSYFKNRNKQKKFNDIIQEEVMKLKVKLMKSGDEVTTIKVNQKMK